MALGGRAIGFQPLIAVLAPALILPLFNKFTLLAEGSLRAGLALAERTGFRVQYSSDGRQQTLATLNAFFTGFGRFEKSRSSTR